MTGPESQAGIECQGHCTRLDSRCLGQLPFSFEHCMGVEYTWKGSGVHTSRWDEIDVLAMRTGSTRTSPGIEASQPLRGWPTNTDFLHPQPCSVRQGQSPPDTSPGALFPCRTPHHRVDRPARRGALVSPVQTQSFESFSK